MSNDKVESKKNQTNNTVKKTVKKPVKKSVKNKKSDQEEENNTQNGYDSVSKTETELTTHPPTKIKKRRSTNKKRLDKPMVFDDFVLQGFGTGKTPQDHEPSK